MLSIALFVFAFFELNPLYKPEEEIKKDLLKVTPIGTNMDNVIVTVKNNREIDRSNIYTKDGYRIAEFGWPYNAGQHDSYTVVGEKSIHFIFGLAGFDSVGAWYGFDENDELVDILVY